MNIKALRHGAYCSPVRGCNGESDAAVFNTEAPAAHFQYYPRLDDSANLIFTTH